MATPDVLDFDRLLRPISDDQPAGVELKENEKLRSVYQAAKDARESARTAEKKLYQSAMFEGEDGEQAKAPIERPDWQTVFTLTTNTLADHSKDLWITAWLIESLARLHGFAGLRDGFRLTREIAERFWDGIHPQPDEDGYATTVAQLTGLNGDESEGALIAPILRIPIIAAGSLRALTSSDYVQAVELEKMTDMDKRAQRINRGAVPLDAFDKAVRETPPAFFQTLLDDVQQAIDEFFKLGEVLESRCGKTHDGSPAAPPTSAIRNALVEVRDRVQSLAQSVIGSQNSGGSTDEDSAATTSMETGAATPAAAGGRKAMNRDEAFRQLLQVAEFFRKTEPHSPVSYALEQAVRWGRMPLPDLLSELISDSTIREDLFRRMGIAKPDSDEG